MNFHSQRGEDRWIAENIKLPDHGFYVDIGAAWPDSISNTAFLREKGWQGIQIDADPAYTPLWRNQGLELTVAVVWIEERAAFKVNPEYSGISKIEPGAPLVPARKINDILAEKNVQKIDLLSIDVEGSEYAIMTSLDWDKYAPTVLIWEYNTCGKEDHRLAEFIEKRGYRCVSKTEHNYIHMRDEN